MARTYEWDRDTSDEQHTEEVFGALARVKDLSVLVDVEATIHDGESFRFGSVRRRRAGHVVADRGPWMVMTEDGVPGSNLSGLRFTVPD